jgi:hypothetical protein
VHPWAIYANEITRERDRRLQQDRWLAEARFERGPRPSRTRRSMAIVLAALSRSSAAAVRRLDDCVADDLQHALAASE